jgi:hypothetical protein
VHLCCNAETHPHLILNLFRFLLLQSVHSVFFETATHIYNCENMRIYIVLLSSKSNIFFKVCNNTYSIFSEFSFLYLNSFFYVHSECVSLFSQHKSTLFSVWTFIGFVLLLTLTIFMIFSLPLYVLLSNRYWTALFPFPNVIISVPELIASIHLTLLVSDVVSLSIVFSAVPYCINLKRN